MKAGSNMFSWVPQLAFDAIYEHWLGEQRGAWSLPVVLLSAGVWGQMAQKPSQ